MDIYQLSFKIHRGLLRQKISTRKSIKKTSEDDWVISKVLLDVIVTEVSLVFSLQKREAPSLVDTAALLQCVHQPAQPTAALHPHPHPSRSTTPPTSTTTTSTTWDLRPLPCQHHPSQLLLPPLSTANSTSGNTSPLHHHAPARCLPHPQLLCQPLLHLAHRCVWPLLQSAHQPAHQCAARSDQDKGSDLYIQEECDSDGDAVVYGVVLWCVFMMSAVNTAATPRKRPEANIKPLITSVYGRFCRIFSRSSDQLMCDSFYCSRRNLINSIKCC